MIFERDFNMFFDGALTVFNIVLWIVILVIIVVGIVQLAKTIKRVNRYLVKKKNGTAKGLNLKKSSSFRSSV